MKILNLYAGIGGNRKLWGDEHEITAVEYKEDIAGVYRDFYPNDEVVVGDAHQYLLENFAKYDFIWSSPPCPTHSKVRFVATYDKQGNIRQKPVYPDMKLYEEIIFLKHYFKGLFCVENVVGYYEPLVKPQEVGKHYFWANFVIPPFRANTRGHYDTIERLQEIKGISLRDYDIPRKRLLLRNCVFPELGRHILHFAQNPIVEQSELF